MRKLFIFLVVLCTQNMWSQMEWHVRPYANNYVNPPLADGLSVATAWCLQYALAGGLNGTQIQAGDIVWLHGVDKATYVGSPPTNNVYKGHFKSTLKSTDPLRYITVSSYPGEWAVIDGNIHNGLTSGIWGPITPTPLLPTGTSDVFILHVLGGNVNFENFEITCLGDFSRIKDTRAQLPIVPSGQYQPLCPPTSPPQYDFHEYVGIQHEPYLTTIRNEFRNLIFRNIPGIALGSWKKTLDTEIYGNIFYNNGIIEVTAVNGVDCQTLLEDVPLYNGDLINGTNTRGHQTCIYTQNDSGVVRRIRNNLFLNCYDSAVNIWSALDATGIVNNYEVSKNVFINNGSPVLDETANMIVSANGGRINNIEIFSNLYYKNGITSGNSGLKIDAVTNINIKNNYFVNGAACLIASESNHRLTFENNFYAGKRLQILTSIANFQGTAAGNVPGDAWSMGLNNYYNKYLGTALPYMFLAPNTTTSISLDTFRNNYNTEFGSFRYVHSLNTATRYFIVQNEYNPNVFYVSIYLPQESLNPQTPIAPVDINFSDYNIPNGKVYRIKDVQNYLTSSTPLGQGTYNIPTTNNIVSFPIPVPSTNILNPNNFELPLPSQPNSIYGVAYVPATAPPIHSDKDFNTYVIEFDCDFAYKKHDDFITIPDTGVKTYLAKHNINFEPNYTATTASANITSTAGNQILLRPGTYIGNNAKFLAKIGDPCTSIAFNHALDNAEFDMMSGLNRNSNLNLDGKTDSSNKEYFIIYPNPSSGISTIESLKSEKINHVQITKVNSSSIVLEEFYNNLKVVKIDISKEESGLYVVQVFFEDKSSQTKTIIKK